MYPININNQQQRDTIPAAVQRFDADEGALRQMKAAVYSGRFSVLFRRDPRNAVKGIKNLIEKAYAWRKSNSEPIDPRELVELAGTLATVIATYYPGLFPAELETIFWNGICKDYGEIYGLAPGTFIDWIEAYLKTSDHHIFVKKLFDEQRATAIKQLPEHASPDDTHTAILRNYKQYREGVLSRENAKIREEASGDIGQAFKKATAGPAHHAAGSPLWDFDGTEFAGARARWMNEHGFPGANLEEIFKKMINDGIETF